MRSDDTIDGLIASEISSPAESSNNTKRRTFGALGSPDAVPAPSLLSDQWTPRMAARADSPPDSTPDTQYLALYLDPDSKSLVLPISNKVTPKLSGESKAPDIEMRIELDALHLPDRDIKSGTVKIQVSQDDRFTEGREALSWVVAAGLNLYEDFKTKGASPLKPGDLKADLVKPFAGRPISLPGGAGYIKIDILQDSKKSLLENMWESIVAIFKTPQGMALAVTVGFPAIGLPAVAFIDQLIGRYKADTAVPVIEGRKMRWALNKAALERLLLGSNGMVEFPVMNSGYYVLVPAGRLGNLLGSKPKYVGGFGYFVPGNVDITDQAALANYLDQVANGNYEYGELPYAVIRVEIRETDASKNWS